MTFHRPRFKSSVLATVGGAALVAAAIVGGVASDQDAPAVKGDRFAVAQQKICGQQSWPNISAECIAWRNGTPGSDVRYITVSTSDRAAGITTLTRVAQH